MIPTLSVLLSLLAAASSSLRPLIYRQPYGLFLYDLLPGDNIWNRIQSESYYFSRDDYQDDASEQLTSGIEGRYNARRPAISDQFQQVEGRLRPSLRNPLSNLATSGNFGTRFSNLASNLAMARMDGSTCTSPNAEAGICTNSRACANYGGRSSGSCSSIGSVCCINTVTQCGATVTLNNTYWQSSSTISSDSTCSLSIKLDPTLVEQRRNPICQIRLDFDSFSIAQPDVQTVCSTDNFRVSGAINRIPIICGQNVGQHMYLAAPSSTSDVQLIFTLGTGMAIDRNWRIRIGLLPCSTPTILAPDDCLQYFAQSTGTVRSFNWRELSPSATAPRQLANQDYNICFRTELISTTNTFPRVSSTICFTSCVITTTVVAPLRPPLAFSLTGDSTSTFLAAGAGAGATPPQCSNTDYVVIDNAIDPAATTNFNDRFCGNQLNAQTNPVVTTSTTLCSNNKPFNVYYRTDGSETASEFGNNGFCLRFEQRA